MKCVKVVMNSGWCITGSLSEVASPLRQFHDFPNLDRVGGHRMLCRVAPVLPHQAAARTHIHFAIMPFEGMPHAPWNYAI